MATSSSRSLTTGLTDNDFIDRDIQFVCPNFASAYIPGVVMIPTEFCLAFAANIPERLLIHVPGKVVWNGILCKDKFWIEGLENMMIFYSIKPYYLLLFTYVGGPSFNIQIFNPYAVEINYSVSGNSSGNSVKDRRFFNFSDIEVDRLCGTLCYNGYNSGQGLYHLALRRKHLRKTDYYKILKRKACWKLGLDDSMNYVKLSFKNLTWVVNLKWNNGNVYFDRKWYAFSKAGNMKEGDRVVFQMTRKKQKFLVYVFESDLHTKCNTAGPGHNTGVMSWFKIVNENFLVAGSLEIPMVFVESESLTFAEKVTLIMGDGESVVVDLCARRHLLTGMNELLREYSVNLNYVMVFRFVSRSTFAVYVFNSAGMLLDYTIAPSKLSTTVKSVQHPEVILLPDSSGENIENDVEDSTNEGLNADVAVNDVDAILEELEEEMVSFQVTLQPSHVDKRCHGVYLPQRFYSTFKNWRRSTTIRLFCGANVHGVSVLRSNKMCRLGRGWTEFTVANELAEGPTLRMDYVHDKTFQVTVLD